MDTPEILRRFERFTGKFERAAVEAAVARRDEIVPELLRILEDTTARAAQIDAEDDSMGHLYAMFLLAQFREVRAYPILVRFASLPGDTLDSLCGDFITDYLGRVLTSVCGGELAGIKSLIENRKVDQWVRVAALDSLVTLVATGPERREEVLTYFAELFRGKLEREWSHAWDELVCCACDIYPEELIGDIEQAYEEDLVDQSCIDLRDVRREMARGKARTLAELSSDPHHHLVEDTIKEMEWWECFRDGGRDRQPANEPGSSGEMRPLPQISVPPPFTRSQPKIGRNGPCPCGSGKKYKKCCGT